MKTINWNGDLYVCNVNLLLDEMLFYCINPVLEKTSPRWNHDGSGNTYCRDTQRFPLLRNRTLKTHLFATKIN